MDVTMSHPMRAQPIGEICLKNPMSSAVRIMAILLPTQ